MKAITTQYIDGAFVESHGREVMDSINPNNGTLIVRVTLGDEEDARRARCAVGPYSLSAYWREFGTFGIEAFLEPRAILE